MATPSAETTIPSTPSQDRDIMTYKTTKMGYEQMMPLNVIWRRIRELDGSARLQSNLKDYQTERVHLITWTQRHNKPGASTRSGVLEIWHDDPHGNGNIPITTTTCTGELPKLIEYLERMRKDREWFEYAVASQTEVDEMTTAIMKGDFE